MDKNEVRQLIKGYRHELSDEDVKRQSILIIDRLKKSDIYKASENVFYISVITGKLIHFCCFPSALRTIRKYMHRGFYQRQIWNSIVFQMNMIL